MEEKRARQKKVLIEQEEQHKTAGSKEQFQLFQVSGVLMATLTFVWDALGFKLLQCKTHLQQYEMIRVHAQHSVIYKVGEVASSPTPYHVVSCLVSFFTSTTVKRDFVAGKAFFVAQGRGHVTVMHRLNKTILLAYCFWRKKQHNSQKEIDYPKQKKKKKNNQ